MSSIYDEPDYPGYPEEDDSMDLTDLTGEASFVPSPTTGHQPDVYRPRPYPRPQVKKPNFFQTYGAYRPNSIFGFAAKRYQMESGIANQQYQADVADWRAQEKEHDDAVREQHYHAQEDVARKRLESLKALRNRPHYVMSPYTLPSGETVMLQHDTLGNVAGFRDAQGNEFKMPSGTVPYQKPDQSITNTDMWSRAFVKEHGREPRTDEVDAHQRAVAAAGRAPDRPYNERVSFDKDGKAWLIDPRSGVAKPVQYPGETAPPTFNPPNAPRGEKEITNAEIRRQAMKMEADMQKRGVPPKMIKQRLMEFKESQSPLAEKHDKARVAAATAPPAPAPTAAPKQYKYTSTNKKTGERMGSNDGVNWEPLQ